MKTTPAGLHCEKAETALGDKSVVIGALQSKAEEIRVAQMTRTLKKFSSLSEEQRATLEAMTKSIVTRILHDPIQYLKSGGDGDESEIIKELFRLDLDDRP